MRTTTAKKKLRKKATVRAPRYHAKKSEFRIISCPNEMWVVQRYRKPDQKYLESISDLRTLDPWRSLFRPTTFGTAIEQMNVLASISAT